MLMNRKLLSIFLGYQNYLHFEKSVEYIPKCFKYIKYTILAHIMIIINSKIAITSKNKKGFAFCNKNDYL